MTRIGGTSRRRKAAAGLSVAVGGALAAVALVEPVGSASTRPAVRTLAVRQASGPVAGLFVAAGRVRGPRDAALAGTASSPLSGWVAPVAVPSADGSQLVYSTWRELRHDDPALSWSKQGIRPGQPLGTPTLWVHDFRSGRDSVVDRNAFSAAVRADGAVAYVRGRDVYRAFTPYAGDVVVRSSLSAKPVVWSTAPALYVAAAWAGDTLLVQRIGEGEQLDLFALDGPGRQRLLMAHAALVAVSPDGRQAFVANSDAVQPGAVSLVDVADGTVVSTLELASLEPGLEWAAYGGAWAGDRVVAPTNAGIAVFDVAAGAISLAELLKPDPQVFPDGIVEPQFSGDGEHVVARGDAPDGADGERTSALECDLRTATCLAEAAEPGRDWLHPAYNPSRPLKGGGS